MSDKMMLFEAMSAILFAGGSAPQVCGSEKAVTANPASVKQWPDFCSGIAGNLTIQCVNDEFRQFPAKAIN